MLVQPLRFAQDLPLSGKFGRFLQTEEFDLKSTISTVVDILRKSFATNSFQWSEIINYSKEFMLKWKVEYS
jgi:hypothetical protein